MIGIRFGTLFCLGALFLSAQELRDYERKVTEFSLPNGLHFIVLERHQVPVVSFHTYVNVGYSRDPAGQTGMAHMFEHLAFKGSETVGTRNWAAEKKALDDVDEAVARLEVERNRGNRADAGRLTTLQIDIQKAIDTAQSMADSDEFARVIQENGGVELSARTSADAIDTSYSLPSNRLELWFLLESDRLAHPVLRDFYHERDVMQLENHNNVDLRGLPKLQQGLLATAFAALPYRNPPLGWPSDIASLKRSDAKAFFDTYFVPANMVMSIVGDVDPATARRLAEKYFGGIPAKPAPPWPHTAEPTQLGPKTVTLLSPSQSMLLVGFKRPPETDRDDVVFDVIRTILADGHASWMYKDLVEQKRVAQAVDAVSTFPAGRYPNLFVFTVTPAKDHTIEENQKAMDALFARLENEPVDPQTLDRVKNEVRTRTARVLSNNRDLAFLLTSYYANFGDWRRLFTSVGDVGHVRPEDIQRVAGQYFGQANRTVAYLTDAPPPSAAPAAPKGAQ